MEYEILKTTVGKVDGTVPPTTYYAIGFVGGDIRSFELLEKRNELVKRIAQYLNLNWSIHRGRQSFIECFGEKFFRS